MSKSKKILLQRFDNGAKLILKLPKNKKKSYKKKLKKNKKEFLKNDFPAMPFYPTGYDFLRKKNVHPEPLFRPNDGNIETLNPIYHATYPNISEDITDKSKKILNEMFEEDEKAEVFNGEKELEKGSIKPVEDFKDEFKETKDTEDEVEPEETSNENIQETCDGGINIMQTHRIIDAMVSFINEVEATVQYDNWSDQFSREHVNRNAKRLTEKLVSYIDFNKLTIKDAMNLRFAKWTDDLYLIPLYLYPIIPIGTKLTTINGDTVIFDGKNVDLDTRAGYLAYGIHLQEDESHIPYDEAIKLIADEFHCYHVDESTGLDTLLAIRGILDRAGILDFDEE